MSLSLMCSRIILGRWTNTSIQKTNNLHQNNKNGHFQGTLYNHIHLKLTPIVDGSINTCNKKQDTHIDYEFSLS
jgi:hypothetical protein